jgi:DNA-binding response OmpR family regulator
MGMHLVLFATKAPGATVSKNQLSALPALALLSHTVTVTQKELSAAPFDWVNFLLATAPQVVLIDARYDLVNARTMCRMVRSAGIRTAIIAVLTEGGLAAVSADWEVDDVVLTNAGPAEVMARLRLVVGGVTEVSSANAIQVGELVIDTTSYSVKLRGHSLDLTYKEFELLRFLAEHAGQVFTREQLLQQVWGFDYFGGTRTVDVHVRRLRAKLGSEYEGVIGTVRNVGYRLVIPPARPLAERDEVSV